MKTQTKSHRSLAGDNPATMDVKGMTLWLKQAQKGGKKWSGLRVVNRKVKDAN